MLKLYVGMLYHFGARYYDPLIGRWTQQDPLDQVGDLREANRYVYVAGDPVNNVDPSGERLVPCVTGPCPWADDLDRGLRRYGTLAATGGTCTAVGVKSAAARFSSRIPAVGKWTEAGCAAYGVYSLGKEALGR